MNTTATPPSRLRSRLTLLLIVAMFFASFGIALVLRFTGWTPQHTRNSGTLLEPPVDLATADLLEEADARLALANDARTWTALVRVPAACDDTCWQKVALLTRVRAALGRHAAELRLRVLDASLPVAHRDALAPVQTLTVRGGLPNDMVGPATGGPDLWLVDPHGYAVLYYPPGFDPGGLRKDLGRLLK
jgi:hypothetical protein